MLDGKGYIATNAHVVTSEPGEPRAKQVYVEFSDGNRVSAQVVGADLNADVALVKVDPSGLRSRRSSSAIRTTSRWASRSRRSAARSASASRSRSA